MGLAAGTTAASAAVSTHHPATSARVLSTTARQASGVVRALGAPSGCPYGDVCFYYQGNGGDLCGYSNANSYNLGSGTYGLAPYGNHCENIGPSGSIFNNGAPCSGCGDVKLYYNKGYTGAWYCLPRGHYLLYIEQNHFNGGGSGAAGYGQTLAYEPNPPYGPGPGGVASAYWTTC
ncbi:MAG: hypothetical protein ACYCVZ_02895 [Streptosporangiaceae bacterium]